MGFSWPKKRVFPSERNGNLTVRTDLLRPVVTVNGFFQTGPYMDALWKKALCRIPKKTPIKRVLLLGYGAGGTNRIIRNRFPHARITAVEWDPQMAEIAKKFNLHRPEDLADLRIGDAAEVVPHLDGTFDLIIFDLYRGKQPSPLIEDATFLAHLRERLDRHGFFLVNAFGKPDVLPNIAKIFSPHARWKYQYNHCALYRPFGNGNAGDPLLPGFLPFHAVGGLVEREIPIHPGNSFVGGPAAGRRWKVGPVTFELYYGDSEPTIEPVKGWRVIYWQTLSRTDIPKGWFRCPYMPNFRMTGYAPVGNIDSYWNAWSSHAQRHRKKWLARPDAEIKSVGLEEFVEVYKDGTLDWILKKMFIWMLRRKARAHGDLMKYWIAVQPDGKAIAGLVVLDIPETKTSLHVIAFHTKASRHSSVNYGLIDYWFRDCIARGLIYVDLDVFRGPGDPRSWRGFTTFKRQFDTRFILYKNPLMRFRDG